MSAELITDESTFVVPLNSKEHESQIKAVINQMVSFTLQLDVVNDAAYKKVTSLYRQARDWKKAIEAKRKQLVDPLRRQTSLINDKAKDLTDPLDQVIDMANMKASGYTKMLEEAKKKEDERIRLAASLFDAEDEVYIPPMEKNIRGEGASTFTKIEKKFKVVDISKVPLKYLTVNEKAVEMDIKMGINAIPGLEIYETQTTTLRSR